MDGVNLKQFSAIRCMSMTAQRYLEEFNPNVFFSKCVHWEIFYKDRAYYPIDVKEDITCQTILYHLVAYNTITGEECTSVLYVGWERHFSAKELQELLPYCRCYRCTAKWYNPLRYIYGPVTCGCISAAIQDDAFASAHVIQKTREYYDSVKRD